VFLVVNVFKSTKVPTKQNQETNKQIIRI